MELMSPDVCSLESLLFQYLAGEWVWRHVVTLCESRDIILSWLSHQNTQLYFPAHVCFIIISFAVFMRRSVLVRVTPAV